MKQLDKINNLFVKRFKNAAPVLPLYNPDISFEELRFSGLPFLKLDIDIPVENILQEILSVDLVPHRDDYGEHKGWHSFSIHGKSYDTTTEVEDKRPMVWTSEALEFMPFTVNWFIKSYPAAEFARVRIMRLDPGGYISLHKDTDIKRLDPVNIAITQPDGCDFIVEHNGIVPFSAGTAMWLDVSNRHTVINNSNKPRYHLIVHAKHNKSFKDIALKSYKNLYKNG